MSALLCKAWGWRRLFRLPEPSEAISGAAVRHSGGGAEGPAAAHRPQSFLVIISQLAEPGTRLRIRVLIIGRVGERVRPQNSQRSVLHGRTMGPFGRRVP